MSEWARVTGTALAPLVALPLLGGAVALRPPTTHDGVISEAPVCVRLLPSGVVVEGPEVCPSPDVAPEDAS